jgi:hypothetical protein
VAFPALAAACFVITRRFRADGRRGWAAYSLATGLGLLAPDVFVGREAFFLVLALAVALGCTWTSCVAGRLLIDQS